LVEARIAWPLRAGLDRLAQKVLHTDAHTHTYTHTRIHTHALSFTLTHTHTFIWLSCVKPATGRWQAGVPYGSPRLRSDTVDGS